MNMNTVGRIVNKNPYLFGPGPVKRVQKPGFFTQYSRMEPAAGFSLAALHGSIFALAGALLFKFTVTDPQLKAIEDYYKENPPR